MSVWGRETCKTAHMWVETDDHGRRCNRSIYHSSCSGSCLCPCPYLYYCIYVNIFLLYYYYYFFENSVTATTRMKWKVSGLMSFRLNDEPGSRADRPPLMWVHCFRTTRLRIHNFSRALFGMTYARLRKPPCAYYRSREISLGKPCGEGAILSQRSSSDRPLKGKT